MRVLCALFLAAVSGWAQGRAEWNARIEPNRVLGNIYYVGPLGVHLVDNAGYPNIAEDYARTFRVLKSLSCDPVGQASWPVVGSHSIQSGEAGGGAEL